MKRKLITLLASVILSSSVLCGCEAKPKQSEKIITDMGGVEITIPDEINKVVCCTNPGTDMMLAFGAGDTLVGAYKTIVTNPWFYEFYPDADQLTLLDNYEPEAEGMYALDADIVFLPSEENCIPLREKGICAVCLRYYNIEETKRAAELLGEIFGGEVESNSKKWLSELDQTISEVDSLLAETSTEDKKSVYEILGDKYRGLFRTNYGDNQAWIEFAGGTIATKQFNDSDPVNMPTDEAVLATNPDIILLSGIYNEQLKKDLLSDEKWSTVNAVVQQEIYNVPISCTSWSENTSAYPLMIKYLFTLLYPELSPYSMLDETKEFHKTYYGIDFSDQQISNMLATVGPTGESLCPPIE